MTSGNSGVEGTARARGKRSAGSRTAGGAARDTVYFVSDAHFGLGGDDAVKVARFGELAAQMRKHAAAVYILGDLFDFWIEYRCAIRPDYFQALHELRGLVEAGIEVCYVAGNHDFAHGGFLEKSVGIPIHTLCRAELQGRRVYMRHGDHIRRNGALKIASRLLRNRLFQTLYKMLHPNVGVRLGAFCSAVSKKINNGRGASKKTVQKFRQAAHARLKTGECDLVILAHTHHSELIKFDDGGEYCNVGSWMGNYDYAVMRNGEIEVCRWGKSQKH